MTLFDFIWLTGSSVAFMLCLAYCLTHNTKTDIIGSLILGLIFSWTLVILYLIVFYKGRWK
mgnify:CR=1 FL=1